jgi:hypothetical protein
MILTTTPNKFKAVLGQVKTAIVFPAQCKDEYRLFSVKSKDICFCLLYSNTEINYNTAQTF